MNKRTFLKSAATLASTAFMSSFSWPLSNKKRLRTAHIGVGGMGLEDLKAISSHNSVEVIALCDVDSNHLNFAKAIYPNAKTFSDYRILFDTIGDQIDAVVVSTPDHTHAPASLMAMDIGKAVSDVKKGKIDFKVEKNGIIHASVAKVSFDSEKIVDNAKELIQTIVKLKPSAAKGTYLKSIYMSSTMGLGIQIDTNTFI